MKTIGRHLLRPRALIAIGVFGVVATLMAGDDLINIASQVVDY
jgi:hypothetical protein